MKNVTLGQYFPGDSFLHRLDPRCKLILTIALIVVVFCVKNFTGFALIALLIALCVSISKISVKYMLKGLKPLFFIITLTFLLNLFMLKTGEVLCKWWIFTIYTDGLRTAVFMAVRLVMLILCSQLLTLTTSPISLTDGLESLMKPLAKLHFPAHEISMMMSIALRFIPTLMEETDKIRRAQMARGADFESGNILQRVKAMIPLLVPLFISAFRRADELAMAMEARCYRGGAGRTKMKVLHYSVRDLIAFLILAALLAGVLVLNTLPMVP